MISMAVAENKIGLIQFSLVVHCFVPMVDGTTSTYYQVYHFSPKMLSLIIYSFAKYQYFALGFFSMLSIMSA